MTMIGEYVLLEAEGTDDDNWGICIARGRQKVPMMMMIGEFDFQDRMLETENLILLSVFH